MQDFAVCARVATSGGEHALTGPGCQGVGALFCSLYKKGKMFDISILSIIINFILDIPVFKSSTAGAMCGK